MQGFNRRKFLKTIGISAVTAGLTTSLGSLRSFGADGIDWYQNINRVKDPLNKTPKEKGHAPVVRWPINIKSGEPFNIDIQIGESLHPMAPNHYIQWIEVYAGIEQVSRIEFSPLCPQAKVTIPIAVKGSSTLKILTRCNLHGIWETAKKVTV
ncbi:MAG: twin-arginine translocation signal domain-containing protein [Planctomycetia bacterium]|nr:twin-arginine translocation signal domain-containing protein [Planctomycetia bacterium]